MDTSSDDDANLKPKKASLPPKTQPNLGSSSSEDLVPMHAKKITDSKVVVADKPPSIKEVSLVVPEKPKKHKKKKKEKENDNGQKKKKNKSSLVFSTDSELDNAEPA